MKNSVRRLRKTVYTSAAIVFAAFLSVIMLLTASAAEGENSISALTVNKAKTEITATVSLTKEYVKENKSATLYLFEFLPHNSEEDLNSMEAAATFKTDKKVTVKIPFEKGNTNRLYSGFAVAEKTADGSFSLITPVRFLDNLSDYAKNQEPYPVGSSKKGLKILSFADAQILGVQHTVIEIPVNEYMLGGMEEGAASFVYSGRTYYINEKQLLKLDHQVRTYTEAGINVYFNVVLTAPQSHYTGDVLSLYFDGISQEAKYYAINTRSDTAMSLYSAFMNYICERYTSPDHTYGFVPAIILGYEVNSGEKSNNFGNFEKSEYIDSYATLFRVAYTAMRTHYSEGRVYISLGNNFGIAEGEKDVRAKDFLDGFNEAIKSSGDIEWGLSLNPYSCDRGLVDYWNDGSATEDISSEYITMKNIGVLTDYMRGEEFLYNAEPRSVIIGEFGIAGAPADDNAMTMQAAAYALAYYTADQNEDIDAFIYSCHVDNPKSEFSCGLWTSKPGDEAVKVAKKPIYNVFSLIDTEKSQEVTAFVKSAVGNAAFEMFLPGNVKYKKFNDRTYITEAAVPTSELEKKYTHKTLFDLTAGKVFNFYPSDETEYVELRPVADGSGTTLYARISEAPTDYKGIGNASISDTAFKKGEYITLRLMVEAPVDVSTVNVMVRLQKNGDGEFNTAVLEGTTQIGTNSWQSVSFKISELTEATEGDVDLLKVWVSGDDEELVDGTYGIWLENVVIHTKKGMSFIGWFFTVLLILVALVVGGYFALYLRAELIRRRRREEIERRRREQLRMQAMQQSRYFGNPDRFDNYDE